MSNSTKYSYFLMFVFLGLFTCKYFLSERKDYIYIDGIKIDKRTCYNVISSFFGNAVDSVKACECILPSFYNAIKSDSELVQQFIIYKSLFVVKGPLEKPSKDAINICVKENIVDTSMAAILSQEFKLQFKEKLLRDLEIRPEFETIDKEKVSHCIADKLIGKISVYEYFSDDYFGNPKIKKILADCLEDDQ